MGCGDGRSLRYEIAVDVVAMNRNEKQNSAHVVIYFTAEKEILSYSA